MSTDSRLHATLWVLSLLLLASYAVAGPVAGDEAASAPMGMAAVPASAPGMSPPPDGSATSAAGMAGGPSANGDAPAAGSTLALELLKEAEAGASASEGLRRTARPAAQNASAPAAPGPASRSKAEDAEGESSLREMGKAAVHWLQESLPWLRKEPEDDDRQHDALPGTVGWSGSPLEGGRPGSGGPADAIAPVGGPALTQPGPDAVVGYGSNTRNAPELRRNVISEFIQVVRMVLEHPMTWLIVSLFVVGGIALRKFDRRPK